MAKHDDPSSENFDLNDDGFGEFNDFDFDNDDPFGSSKPKTTKERAKSIARGIATGSLDHLNAEKKQILKKVLPNQYSNSIDTVSDAYSTTKDILDETKKAFQPYVKELKEAMGRVMPDNIPLMPESWSKKIKEALASEEEYKSSSRQSIENDQILQSLGEIFKIQSQHQEREEKRTASVGRFNNLLSLKTTEASIKQLALIRMATERLVGYQDTIAYNYQKKSLELQYRQYFTNKELLEEFKAYRSESKMAREYIYRSVSMSDLEKRQSNGHKLGFLKNMAYNTAKSAVGRSLSSVFGNIRKNAKSKLDDAASNFGVGTAQLSLMADSIAAMRDLGGIDPYDMAGGGIGQFLTEALLDKFIPGFRDKIAKDGRVGSIGNYVDGINRSLSSRLNDMAKGSGGDFGFKGMLKELFSDLIGPEYRTNTIRKDTGVDLDAVAAFNRRTQLSITEVIPGWLSKIYTEIGRVGGNPSEEIHWDHAKGTFVNKGAARAQLKRDVFDRQKESIGRQMPSLIKALEGEGKLSDGAKDVLGRLALESASHGSHLDTKALGDKAYYKERGVHPEIADELSRHFKSQFQYADVDTSPLLDADGMEIDGDSGFFDGLRASAHKAKQRLSAEKSDMLNSTLQARSNAVQKAYEDLMRYYEDPRQALAVAASNGNLDLVRGMDFVGRGEKEDFLDRDAYHN